MKVNRSACILAVFLVLAPVAAYGQGFLVDLDEQHHFRLPHPIPHPWPIPRPRPPQPPATYKIERLAIEGRLENQIARLQVSQTFVNTGSRTMEVSFIFPLPYDGAVDQLTFLVDGREYEARLLTAAEARRIYESYVRRNRDPALLEWIGTGLFKTSVFPVPPGAERTVTLRYNQLCRRQDGVTDLLIPLQAAKYTSQPLKDISLRLTIQSDAKIKSIYSPTHDIDIDRSDKRHAVVSYRAHDETPMSDFRLFYNVGDDVVGASLLSHRPDKKEDGYFLLLVTPDMQVDEKDTVRKTVLFVVDRSGSMSGKKIEQAREALRFVLNHLNSGDLFNIIAYDSNVELFRDELQRFGNKTRKAAMRFVDDLYAGGSTNIDGALEAAFDQLTDEKQPAYIVFLTDGLPTVGERSAAKIVEHARKANRVRARLFAFGVGYDVNSRLLDGLTRTCFGQSHYVRPDEDIEEHVARLYSRIGAPVLTDVQLTFRSRSPQEDDPGIRRMYPREPFDLFAGDQLVVVGRYRQGGPVDIVLRGKMGDGTRSFRFKGELAKRSSADNHGYIEKLWAMRRVGEIIDEIDLHGRNEELVDELVELSKRHGIMTPYTSFLADDDMDQTDLAAVRMRVVDGLGALQEEAGRSGFAQRDFKATLQSSVRAPAASGGAVYRDVEADREVRVTTVRQIGSKTFYLRGGKWVDSELTDELEKRVKRVERYSAEYFQLIDRYGSAVAKYLALEGEVTVVLDGQAYTF